MNEPLSLRVLGQKVPLKSSNRDHEKIREILAFVQDRIYHSEVRCKPSSPAFQPLLLALLDLAEEYLDAKKKIAEHQQDLSRTSTRLTEILEKELGPNH